MGSTIKKKDRKICDVVSMLPDDFSDDDFIARFQDIYPEDWEKIGEKYRQQLSSHVPGAVMTMPEPRRYLLNILGVWKRKQERIKGEPLLDAVD